MLIPVGIIGTLVFLLGSTSLYGTFAQRNSEVCTSDKMMCPKCLNERCKYVPLRNACNNVKMMSFFDNVLVLSFSIVMTIWGILFVVLWVREHSVLQMTWNLRFIRTDYSMRPGYAENTKYRKISVVTGLEEPYVPSKIIFLNYMVTFSVITLMIFLMVLGIFGIIIYSLSVTAVLTKYQWFEKHKVNVGLLVSVTGSTISVIFIFIWDKLYQQVATWLTNRENPRTQQEYDNSYTYKAFLITFVNNFAAIFYIAFFKTKLYTYPGDKKMWTRDLGMAADHCDIGCCMTELGIQLLIVMLGKNFMMTGKQYLIPKILLFVNKLRHKSEVDVKSLPQWERDYLLNPSEKNGMMDEYMEMVVQYCFVIFFTAVFPPTPLLALLNNLIELRVDAYKLVKAQRRPVTHKVAMRPAWTQILVAITLLGVIVNYLMCMYTSAWTERIYYRQTKNSNLEGFIDFVLSAYNTSEFPIVLEPQKNISRCYYPGMRHPPEHRFRYQHTKHFWEVMVLKAGVFFTLEYLTLTTMACLAFSIPLIPLVMKEHVNYHKEQVKKMQFKAEHDAYMQSQEDVKSVVFEELFD